MERSPGGASSPTSGILIPVYIEPSAFSDIEEASAWYDSQRPGLGTEFILQLDRLLEKAASNPEAYEQVHREFRRALLQRFPFAIYFTPRDGILRVYAVLHQHRSGEFVSSRLG